MGKRKTGQERADKLRRSRAMKSDGNGFIRDDALDIDAWNNLAIETANATSAIVDRLKVSSIMSRQFRFELMGNMKKHAELEQLAIHIINTLVDYIQQPDVSRRWTDSETEMAVEMRADGRSLEEIGLVLDRSVQAVANRITQAVGIKQLEVKIKGMIDGGLDGEHVAGQFSGVLRRS